MKSLGYKIAKIRKSKKQSQGELANILGCSQGNVSYIERGVFIPKNKKELIRWSEGEITAEDFL